MYDFIALIEANKKINDQFSDAPERELPEVSATQPLSVRTSLRLRLSTTLHAIAKAIEPAQPSCEPVTCQQH